MKGLDLDADLMGLLPPDNHNIEHIAASSSQLPSSSPRSSLPALQIPKVRFDDYVSVSLTFSPTDYDRRSVPAAEMTQDEMMCFYQMQVWSYSEAKDYGS